MIKRFIFISLFLLSFSQLVEAQSSTVNRREVSAPSLPSTCISSSNVVDVFVLKTGVAADDGRYWCSATNTWSKDTAGISSGLTIGTTTITSGTNKRCLFDDSGVVGEDGGCTYDKATDIITLIGGFSGPLNGTVGATTPAAATITTLNSLGQHVNSLNGSASTPPFKLTGTWFASGDATTTKPHLLIEPTGATSTNWSTVGTGLGINAPSGFTGNLLDLQNNGATAFRISSNGTITASSGVNTSGNIVNGATTGYYWSGRSSIWSPADSQILLQNNASSDFARLMFGGTTSSFPSIKRSGTSILFRLADDSAGTGINASTYSTETNCSDSAGAAACGSASAGSVVIDASATSVVVSTTAVTANSQIFVQYDSSLGARLSVTCNTTVALPVVTARSAGASFTITVPVAPAANPACYSYFIVN